MRKTLATLATLLVLGACQPRDDSTAPGASTGESSSSERMVIQNKGSDTLVNVAQAWAENYKDVEPNIAVAVTGGGSGTGISAMINGTVDLANASRKMKDKEIQMAKDNGIDPVEHVVGFDALAVFLHPDNPIDSFNLPQLAEIYGEDPGTEKWSQLGVEVPGCPSDEIVVVSRQNNSGTYAYFKKAVLGKEREYRLGTRDMHGSKDVVDLVEKTACAIGYSGLAYATEHINMPCILAEEGGECVLPSPETALDGTYAIARPLLMYTAGQPEGAIGAYLEWILSDVGQCIIAEKGYAPVHTPNCE